jgi:hypothetical protein
VAKQGEAWRESPLILPAKYLCHTRQGFLTCKILGHMNDRSTSPKEVVLRIFIVLKSIVLDLELADFGANDKHNNR